MDVVYLFFLHILFSKHKIRIGSDGLSGRLFTLSLPMTHHHFFGAKVEGTIQTFDRQQIGAKTERVILPVFSGVIFHKRIKKQFQIILVSSVIFQHQGSSLNLRIIFRVVQAEN